MINTSIINNKKIGRSLVGVSLNEYLCRACRSPTTIWTSYHNELVDSRVMMSSDILVTYESRASKNVNIYARVMVYLQRAYTRHPKDRFLGESELCLPTKR